MLSAVLSVEWLLSDFIAFCSKHRVNLDECGNNGSQQGAGHHDYENVGYPQLVCSSPANMPGTIMLSAMKPVQNA